MKDQIISRLKRRLKSVRETLALKAISSIPCKTEVLRPLTDKAAAEIFDRVEIRQEWAEAEDALTRLCQIEDGKTDGVNPGDRRALWYLIKGFRPRSVLEIGTHVGASTLYMAAALQSNARTEPSSTPRLVTVDVEDVNNEVAGYWKRYALQASPKTMLRSMGCEAVVRFVTGNSLTYLDGSKERYDFIFLDGDHSATTVYQEIPRALNLLTRAGLIVLHDYFPKNRPLWSNGSIVLGPYIAVTRLRRECAAMKVIPLGNLPWDTKLNSRTTSLALVTRH
jgi:predicted O-methyltransferase YrrM